MRTIMQASATVAFKVGKPLFIGTVKLSGLREGVVLVANVGFELMYRVESIRAAVEY
jgi:hypothetical protein